MSELKRLQTEWYEKLRASGFTDIEDSFGRLKPEVNTRAQVLKNSGIQAEYYARAAAFLFEAEFATPLDREIWELMSDGRSIRSIAAHVGVNRDKVHKIIIHYQIKAGLRRWKK